jgi:hypothetical protein
MTVTPQQAREILGGTFLEVEEPSPFGAKPLGLVPDILPDIPFTIEELAAVKDHDILLFGPSVDAQGSPLTINRIRELCGWDPGISEPCFYNQDWYLKEPFANETTLRDRWYLVPKEVEGGSRGLDPASLDIGAFPSAILVAYTFFLYERQHPGQYLWVHDYVWCRDQDLNGDRIYVGRYLDPNGCNKNGFSVHRHLRIRSMYGAIKVR